MPIYFKAGPVKWLGDITMVLKRCQISSSDMAVCKMSVPDLKTCDVNLFGCDVGVGAMPHLMDPQFVVQHNEERYVTSSALSLMLNF
jgi:hypothetical protein